jgi:2-polyprenyl-3-methyl-5-hydroxy-6-metoxy-1,4-benzoquinol methylase
MKTWMNVVIYALVCLLLLYAIIRYTLYNLLFIYKTVDQDIRSDQLNIALDKMYDEAIMSNEKALFNDYNRLQIEVFEEGFNCFLFRKYLWSNSYDYLFDVFKGKIHDTMHILDIGCGAGFLAIHLCKHDKNIRFSCIVDSERLYRIALANIKKENLQDRITVYQMDMDNMTPPISNSSFDIIISSESIGYSKDRGQLIKNCADMLKPNGMMFINTISFRNNTPSDRYPRCNEIITKWKYNFSTLNNIVYDLQHADLNNIRYITVDQNLTTAFFINVHDILYLQRYCASHNMASDVYGFYFTPDLVNHFILASRTVTTSSFKD